MIDRPRSRSDRPQPLEIVRVRCSMASIAGAEASLVDLLRSPSGYDVRCYRNAATPEDLSVLVSATADATHVEAASPLGLRIAAALRDFGQVNHQVWTHLTIHPTPRRRSQ